MVDETGPFAVLQSQFGFSAFRPGQAEIIEAIVDGNSVLAVMPTGSGKSLCFQIPAICRGGLTIVVSPLVALMQDQVAALKLTGIAADTINSSRPRSENVDAWRRAADGSLRLLYLSPERLMTERMLAALGKLPVRLIVIDEAHCVSKWGPAFRTEYEDLSRLKSLFDGVPVAAFTATADGATRRDIAAKLLPEQARHFISGFDRPNIYLALEVKRSWKKQLASFLATRVGESGIIYCLSRKKTEETACLVCQLGHRALPYHAGMSSAVRNENQDVFATETGIVMVATIAFGMGIDKADIRFVLHTDLPGSLEAYYQEIGRAGRDGAPADTHMLYGLDDIRMRRMFIENEDSDSDHKRREHKRLDALIAYCEAPTCRRRMLLAYFGEQSEPCGNCDVCLNPAELCDGKVEAQKVLSAIVRTGQRFGAAHIIDVLLGKATEKATALGHELLPTFGVGHDRSKEEWRSIIRQMNATGLLELDIGGYGGLRATLAGRALLRGEGSFQYRADLVKKPARARRSSRPPASAPPTPMSSEENMLLERLKALRLTLAQARQVPAYVIFSDRSLREMAQQRPATRLQFAGIHGVGEARLREFADVFLTTIGSFEADGAVAAPG